MAVGTNKFFFILESPLLWEQGPQIKYRYELSDKDISFSHMETNIFMGKIEINVLSRLDFYLVGFWVFFLVLTWHESALHCGAAHPNH